MHRYKYMFTDESATFKKYSNRPFALPADFTEKVICTKNLSPLLKIKVNITFDGHFFFFFWQLSALCFVSNVVQLLYANQSTCYLSYTITKRYNDIDHVIVAPGGRTRFKVNGRRVCVVITTAAAAGIYGKFVTSPKRANFDRLGIASNDSYNCYNKNNSVNALFGFVINNSVVLQNDNYSPAIGLK